MSSPRLYLYSRFENNKGVEEYDQHNEPYIYNSNDLEGTIACEGPHPDDADHAEEFLKNLIRRGVTHHIAAGDPNDGRGQNKGFLDITNPDDVRRLFSGSNAITIDVSRVENEQYPESSADRYAVTITFTGTNEKYKVHYLTLKNWKDFAAEQFNEDTLRTLYKFREEVLILNNYQIHARLGVNCTAGLGRSGVIAYSLVLAKKLIFDVYLTHYDKSVKIEWSAFYEKCLNDLRKTRPELVQTEEQKALAIATAIQFRRIDNKLPVLNTQELTSTVLKLSRKHAAAQEEAKEQARKRAEASVLAQNQATQTQQQTDQNPLTEIVNIIKKQNFWRKKTHFSLKSAPDGITKMRVALADLERQAEINGSKPSQDDILKELAAIANNRLEQTKGPWYLLFGINKRHETTDLLYNYISLLHNPEKKLPYRTPETLFDQLTKEFKRVDHQAALR